VFTISSLTDYLYSRNALSGLVRNLVVRSFNAAFFQIESEFRPLFMQAENTSRRIYENNFSEESLQFVLLENKLKFEDMFGCHVAVYNKTEETLNVYGYWDSTYYAFKDNSDYSHFNSLAGISDSQNGITLQNDTISFYYLLSGAVKNIGIRYDFPVERYITMLNEQTKLFQSRHYLFNQYNKPIRSSTVMFSDLSEEEFLQDIAFIRKYLLEGATGLIVPSDRKSKRAIYIGRFQDNNMAVATTILIDEVLRRFRVYYYVSFGISIIAILILAYVLQRIIVKLTGPISELTDISKRIQNGSLNTLVPEYHGSNETEQISNTLRAIQGKMKRYVSDLNTTLREKRALEHELKIANRIQSDMIPEPDQALTELPEIDLYAKMIPAKGIAGDFYDYFFLDDFNLFFVIGDVSGKGIPAALFMVKTITLLGLEARKHRDPAKVFASVNEQLCLKNDEGMFVTSLAGIIDIQTGEMVLSDAGHNIPLTSLKNKKFEYSEFTKGRPLGMMPGGSYVNTSVKLNKGDTLVLYTDGFPECVGKKDTMLGEKALKEVLIDQMHSSLTAIANRLWNKLKNFRQGIPASDDTTLLLLRYLGK
jgi:serine phosphatase RsbU (regulator of sigma subunit)